MSDVLRQHDADGAHQAASDHLQGTAPSLAGEFLGSNIRCSLTCFTAIRPLHFCAGAFGRFSWLSP